MPLDRVAQNPADFGARLHDVIIERAADLAELSPDHICLEGRRACPPEDCGGPYGYAALVIALSNPKHPEYKERLERLGSHWEPDAFDIDAVNRQLRPLAAKWRPKGTVRSRTSARTATN